MAKKLSRPKPVTFNPKKPDKKLVRQVLHQAFPWGGGLKEIYAEARCLRDMDTTNWALLRTHLVVNKLVELSMEDEHFRITPKGEAVLSGEDY